MGRRHLTDRDSVDSMGDLRTVSLQCGLTQNQMLHSNVCQPITKVLQILRAAHGDGLRVGGPWNPEIIESLLVQAIYEPF